jgi:hypothetical protein
MRQGAHWCLHVVFQREVHGEKLLTTCIDQQMPNTHTLFLFAVLRKIFHHWSVSPADDNEQHAYDHGRAAALRQQFSSTPARAKTDLRTRVAYL